MADGLDRQLHPPPLRQLLDLGARVLLGEMHRRRPEGLRHPQALLHGVDRHHLRGAGRLRRLHRAEADGAQAEDRGGLPLGEGPRVDRVVGRAHYVTGEQGDVVGEAVGHLAQSQVRVRDQEQLGLGATQVAERLAVPEDSGLVALVELLAPAEEAFAAGRPISPEDPVAGRHTRHVVARGHHLADELVADHEAGLDLDPPVVDVEVRAADAARLDPDDRVVRREQLGLGNLVDLDFPGRLEGDRSHGRSV